MKKIYLATVLFLLCATSFATQLNGIYTVDPSGTASTTNFKNLASAAAFMNGGTRTDGGPGNSAPYGVSGPVIFNISPAVYTETLSLSAIAGCSAANNITFQKLPASTGDVVLNPSVTSGLAVINLNSQVNNYINFKGLYFRPTVTSSATNTSYMIGYGYNNIIDNCIFDYTNCVNSNIYPILSCYYLTVTNSTFFNSTVTNKYQGSALNGCQYVTFNNNIVKNTALSCLYLRQMNNNTFQQCGIGFNTDLSIPGTFNGNTLTNATLTISTFYSAFNIERNKINIDKRYYEGTASGTTINSPLVIYSSGYNTATLKIYNNFISINQDVMPGNTSGIVFQSGQSFQIEVFHNTISVNSAQQDIYPITANANTTFKNNIFSSTGGSKAVYNTGGTWDYNNYYSTASPAYSITDAHAKTKRVYFASAADLHHNNACLTGISTSVTTDIDGNTRSATAPIMGATEATNLTSDGAVLRIISPATQYQPGPSSQNISVKIANNGSAIINNVTANYTINNGAAFTETITGLNILPCDSATASFTSPYSFAQNRTALAVYLSAVNGGADMNNLNDTARINVDILGPMHGIYTVNPAVASTPFNFQRIGEADTAMMNRTIDGATEIQIYNGTYSQSGITLGAVTGSSAANTITFTSFSQDSVQTYINAPFTINGTSNIIIRKLNFDNIMIDGNVSNFIVKNNQIKFFKWLAGSNVSFTNNYIKVLADFNSLTAAVPPITFSSKSGAYITNVFVDNNFFSKATYFNQAGVGTTGFPSIISWQKVTKPEARDNRFKNVNYVNIGYGLIGCCTYTQYAYGSTFQFDNCNDTAFIERNKFDSISTDRFVHDINSSNSNDATPRLSLIVVRNNFFSVTNQLGMAAYAAGACNIEFYYNNVNSRSGGIGTVLTPNMINIKNNIFSSTDGSRVITYNTHPAVADYNDVWTSGSALVVNTSTTPNPTTYATLAQYRAATGTNTNSKSVNPKYVDSINLHVAHPTLLATGTPHPAANPILLDIDNDPRNQLNPCIGADEFSPPSTDVIAIQYLGPKTDFTASVPVQLSVRIKNNGSANLNQVKVRWSINGVEQLPAYNWTGDLAYDSLTGINFGAYTFEMLKYTSLKIWTDLPNAAPDMVPVNDTIRVDSIMPYARGNFTLGGTTPNIISFTKAAEYLTYGGVDSAVNILIRNGKYTEQPIIKYARGTSFSNAITFRGENSNASLDTLSFNSLGTGTTPYFTMRLDSAAYFNFKNITLQSLSTYTREVEFTRKTRFIAFDSCVFTAANNTANTYAHVEGNVINSLAPLDSNVNFTNNRFTGTYSAIQLPLRNGLIKGNRFDNFIAGNSSFGIIHLTGSFPTLANSIAIDSNYISNPIACTLLISGNCYGYGYNTIPGINISSTSLDNNFIISRNRMFVVNRDAIRITSQGTAAHPIKIYNNFIALRSGGEGIYTSGAFTEVVNNTITDSLGTSANLVEIGATNATVRNNIMMRSAPGVVAGNGNNLLYVLSSSVSTLTSNNNAYYFTDSTKSIYNGTASVSLGQWKSAGKDANSIFTLPAFVNEQFDLHINKNKAGAVDIAKKAVPISYVSMDIDDSTRSLMLPCIGADEFTLNPVDAGVAAITSLGTPMAPGNNALIVSIRNYGEQNVTSATVNWSVNGAAQPPYTWSGSIATGDSATNLNVGSFNFNLPQAYIVKAWTSNVNGGADTNLLNDSTTKIVYPALCGNYTVGGSTPDFITPKAAMSYAAFAGVTCPVIFNIRDGQYDESDTLSSVIGSSAVNTITIQSESLDSSKVLIFQTDYPPASGAAVLRIDGAKYITLKKIGVKRTSAPLYHAYYNVIALANDVTGLTISNCDLGSSGPGYVIQYPLAVGTPPSNITINNNKITGGAQAIALAGYITPMQNVVIQNNLFRKPQVYPYGNIAQVDLNYMGNVTVNNNFFDSTSTGGSYTAAGMTLQNSTGKITVTNNRVIKRKGANGFAFSFVTGLNNGDSAVVIANNFITIDSVGNVSGMLCQNMGRNVKLAYNNVLNNCYAAGSSTSAALTISNSFGTGTLKDTIVNNNLTVTGTGSALIQNVSSAGDQTCTNNNIWGSGSKLATYNGTAYTTIAALATASSTHTVTVSINPAYTSNNDLHITELNLRTAGKPLSYVLNDIDNEVRGTTNSTIGADEIILGNNDAGISALLSPLKPFAAGNQIVSVSVKNFGLSNLVSANVNWMLNGVMQSPATFSGNLAFGTTGTLNLGTVNFLVDSGYVIKAWTTSPNGASDANNNNDTLLLANIYPALNGTYTLGGVSPDFKGFSRSSTNLRFGGMLGNVIFNARDGRYNDNLQVDSIPFQNNYNLTWQSESGDSSKVLLAGTSFTGDNLFGTVHLNNVKNITFRKMSFQVKIISASSTYSSLIYMSKKTKNIQFVSNQFIDSTYNIGQGNNTIGARFFYNRDDAAGSSSNNYHSIDSSLLIDLNYFKQVNLTTNPVIDLGGTTHAIFQGSVTDYYLNALVISNNRYDMQLFSKPGIIVTEADSVRISGNKLTGNISFYGRDYMVMDKNTVYHEGFSQNAVTLAGATNRASGKTAIVSNNTIQTVRVGTYNGAQVGNTALFINALDRVSIIHNSIVTSDTGNVTGYNYSAALYMVTTKFDTVKNNIFYNVSGGNLLYQQAVTNYTSNYNDYVYSNHFSTSVNNLAAQRTLYGQDAQSVENIQPYFRGPKDLHASNILLKAAAAVTPSANVYLADLDGQSRGASVCYGADEFTQPLNDMIVLDATPRKIFPEGNNNFSILVYNNGVNPITSFNATASITNYPNNTTPTQNAGSLSTNWNGNIAPGAMATISLGQMNVPLFRNILKINTSNLNGTGSDEVVYDDSLQYDNYYAGLNGNYTFKDNINPANGPAVFSYFSDVSLQLKLGGVYGPSTLNLLPGFYNSNVFYIDSIPNRGALSPLVITSQNGDSSTTGFSTYVNYAMVMYKANNVTIRKLGFTQTISDTYNSLTLGYNSRAITVENCSFKRLGNTGNTTTPNNVLLALIGNYSGQTGYTDSGYTVKNNVFEGGYAGIYAVGNAGALSNADMIISKNSFLNQGGAGISMVNMRSPIIDSNSIVTNTTDATYNGILAESSFGKMKYTKNRIFISADGNGIKTLESYAPPYAPTDTLLVANNFITAGATQANMNMNITVSHPKKTAIYHNSLLNRSTNSAAIGLKTTVINSYAGGRFEVLNNIMFHKTAGIPLSVTKDNYITYVQHNNNLYTPGSVIAQVNGTSYATLANLSASTGIDYSSVSGNPLFVADNDLHADGSIVNNNGSYDAFNQVTNDIDNETRSSSTPDMGADEFTLPNFGAVQLESPLSSCAHSATETVKAWVKNFGTQPRSNVPVAYRINNGAIVRDTVRVVINPADSVLFSFMQTANLSVPMDYNFDIWTAYRGDNLPSNDTLHMLVATTPANNVLPYYTGFEGTNAGWYTGGQNSSFKWGVVFSGVIDSSANGLNAWKSNLTGAHNNNENSYLYSPCFDLTAVTQDPTLNFNLAFQLENATDKAWAEYSTDAGATWTKLGAQGEGLGWYNNAGNYWTGDNHYWHNAKHLLPVMAASDRSSVRVRFVLQTNSSIVQDGIAIDDLSIYTGVNAPVSAGTYTNRTATSTGSATFIPVNDPSGNRIVEINDNGNNLGTISVDVNQNAGNAPTLYNGNYYLGRSFVIHVQNQPVTPVVVRLFITQAEFNAWKAADPTIDQVRSVGVYKFSGSVEDFDLGNNTSGTPLNISPAQISKIPYLDGYFLEFSVSSFSEFWITKGVAVPTGNNCLGSNISFTAATTGATYQWQVDTGTGYSNIFDGGSYSGTNTATLHLTNVPTSYSGYLYRCVVNGAPGPDNILRFTLTWTGAVSNDWGLPGNWSCPTVPDEYTDVVIPGAVPNNPLISVSGSVRKVSSQAGAVITIGTGVHLDIKGK